MVGVAKKLMDKSLIDRKPWISGLLDYRITPQPGSLVSPLQMMTQCRPRERYLPQLPSALGAKEMHQTCQELIKRQGAKPERKDYQELFLRERRRISSLQDHCAQMALHWKRHQRHQMLSNGKC